MRWRSAGIGAGIAGAGALGLAAYSHWQGRRAETAVPPDGRFVDVEGARLHHVDEGSGPAIVMVHGLGGQLRNFSYALASRLSERFRVVTVDRPGSGYSIATGERRPGIAEQAAIVGRFIEALGLDRPLVVGHSLGGAVALALALDRPELVRGLALIAPLTQEETEVPPAFRGLARRSPVSRKLTAHLLGVPLGQIFGPHALKTVFAPEPVPADFDVEGGGRLALRPGNIDASSVDLSAAGEEMAGLARRYLQLKPPVSILYGRGDAILDWRRHGEMTANQIPGARLEAVDGGHMLPITQPDATAAFIARAMAR